LIRDLKKNILFNIIGYTGFTGVLRVIIGVVSQKVIAVFLGASGLAILASFRNLIEILTSFSSVGSRSGIISKTASEKNKDAVRAFLNSTVSLFLSASFFLGLILLWNKKWVLESLQLGFEHIKLIQVIAFIVPFMALSVLMEAVLSGLKAYKPVANIQLLIAFITTFFMVVLIYFFGLYGALTALVCRPVFSFLFYLVYFKKSYALVSYLKSYKPDFSKVKDLLPYISMTLISAGFIQVIEIWLRNLISSEIDLESAGFWTAMNNISSHYFTFVSFVFTLYVLPKFSENNLSFKLYSESKLILKTLLSFVTPALCLLYFFRTPIVHLLYSSDFLEITPLFKWQLTADWFRVIFLVFAYYIVAKKRLVDYFIIELFSFSVFIGLSSSLVNPYGIEGVVMANTIRYVGCLILIVFLLRKKLFS